MPPSHYLDEVGREDLSPPIESMRAGHKIRRFRRHSNRRFVR